MTDQFISVTTLTHGKPPVFDSALAAKSFMKFINEVLLSQPTHENILPSRELIAHFGAGEFNFSDFLPIIIMSYLIHVLFMKLSVLVTVSTIL